MFFRSKKAKENSRLNRRIKKLQKLQAKIEMAGCHGDADLRAKEERLNAIHQEILDLNLKRESIWAGNQIQASRTSQKESKKGKKKP